MTFPSFFPRIFHPSVYQGKSNSKNYFEGWYYKHVDASDNHIWSIIFGISHSEDAHSFIQVIEGKTGISDYIRFPEKDFAYSRKNLFVRIGKNSISDNSIELDLEGEKFRITGRIDYQDVSPFPQRLSSPGIMGWYTYVPFMECYHAVVSMNHYLNGKLSINSKIIDFTEGKGYIEKDWGRSMPSDWIWMQCNHFDFGDNVSLMVSVARIPWLNGHFPGFLSFLKIGKAIFRFATYNRSKIISLVVEPDKVDLVLSNRKQILYLEVDRNTSGQLKAPVLGKMERKIAESLDAAIRIKLTNMNGGVMFEGQGKHTGLEIVGDVTKYILN